jgi:hypothetical protein
VSLLFLQLALIIEVHDDVACLGQQCVSAISLEISKYFFLFFSN